MNKQRWERVSKIIDTLLDLEGEERAKYIEKECAGDQDLQSQVTELLKSIEQSNNDGFLEDTGAFLAHIARDINDTENTYASSLIGEVIGKYRILELLGHGGMGSVFWAERADGAYDKKVALKVLRRGMDTPSNIARFKRERKILANLDHPNIARLLDGGVTKNRLPYLVMEYVDGTPLLDYCNRHNLSIQQRLELFKSVSEAVQHAHRNATIHRDLKPSNIFVTKNGTVKVLDFGIAKLLESNDTHATSFQTKTGSRILTLGYAAPEQFENKAITTATDSYTLGILLYELLTGCHPFNLKNKTFTSVEKLICNQSPSKPSEKFEALPDTEKVDIVKQRSTTSSGLKETLKGDLDAIVTKALRKEPESRYETVEQMLEDLNRYNESLPLMAQSDTPQYRAKKFVRRNRNVVGGILFTLITIIGFSSYHIHQITAERNIAETEAEKAQTVKNFLVDIFGSSNPQSTGFEDKNLSAEQLLIDGENNVSGRLKNQPNAYTEIFVAIADALKGISAFEEAEKSYQKALAKVPETTNPLENKLRIYIKLGNLNIKWIKNKEGYQKALEAQKLLKKIENPPSALEASVFSLLGRITQIRNDYKQAVSYYEKADRIFVNSGLGNSYGYIRMLTGFGRSLIWNSDFKKAEEVLLKSNKLHRQKNANQTLTIAENQKYIAWANRELGNFEQSNRFFLKSIDIKKKLTGDQSFRTAISMYHLARNYTLAGSFEKSEQLAQKVLTIYQEELQPPNAYIQQAKNYVAIAKYNQNELSEAKRLLQEVVKIRTELHGENHAKVAGPAVHLAVVYQKLGQHEKAVSLLEKCIRINTRERGKHSRAVGDDLLKLGNVYRNNGNYKIAEKYFRQAESILTEETPENHYRRAELYFQFAKLKQEIGYNQEAQQYFQQAYDIYIDIFGEENNRAKETKSFLKQIAEG